MTLSSNRLVHELQDPTRSHSNGMRWSSSSKRFEACSCKARRPFRRISNQVADNRMWQPFERIVWVEPRMPLLKCEWEHGLLQKTRLQPIIIIHLRLISPLGQRPSSSQHNQSQRILKCASKNRICWRWCVGLLEGLWNDRMTHNCPRYSEGKVY